MIPHLLILVREIPTGPVFGVFCAVAAIAIASQTYRTYRSGYVYRGRNDRVYRNKDLKAFKRWLFVQVLFVVALALLAIYALLA